ncbi:MAG: hypothetical protein ACYDHH_25975 [Solirubrobacteraceae bacterium]
MHASSLLPPAPVNSVANGSVVDGVTVFMIVLASLTIIYALVDWRRTGSMTVLILAIAGGMMCVFEPALDSVAGVWFSQHGSPIIFTLYGRGIPAWVPPLYVCFFGAGVTATIAAIRNSPTRERLWLLFGLFMIANVALEIPLLNIDHVYTYYANQPLRVLKFPLWMPPVNSFITLLTAVVLYRFEDELRGWRVLQIIPIALTCNAIGNTAPGWPSWLMIDSNLGQVPTQLGGVASYALALWLMSFLVRVVTSKPTHQPPDTPVRTTPREHALV